MNKTALYWIKLEEDKVQCNLCPHNCKINEGQYGVCNVRKNNSGNLETTIYGEISSMADDPIEKKPLYHFYPGEGILSVGTVGCNFHCTFCQNWNISQEKAPTKYIAPDELTKITKRYRSMGVAFTYNEPLIWFEYILDSAKFLQAQDLKVVLVTNGYVNPEPLSELLPYVDAMNIDLKSPKDEFYKKLCKGTVEPVKNTIRMASSKCHVEVTTLLVSGENDSDEDLHDIVDFIAEVNPEIPFHFSRYFPNYQFNAPATDPGCLSKAYTIAKEKLNYVYLGNINIPGSSDTICPKCDSMLVSRSGYFTKITGLDGNKCKNCGKELNFVR